MFQSFSGQATPCKRSVSGEKGDFFPFGDLLQEFFDFEGNTVGMGRKPNEHEVVFIQIGVLIDCFNICVTPQCIKNRLCDFFCVSCEAEVSNESFQRRNSQAKI
jgi:hypothetical protein